MPKGTPTELYAQLLELCDEFRSHGDIGCDVVLEERHTRFDEELSDVVFRTVRELLTNVRRHARARHVSVSSADRRDGSIAITVADDGIGLPPHRRRGNPLDESGGIGLWSIDQRLREFDAVLDIEAAAGRGTRAMLILPAYTVRS
jgi:two-component system sensor histidine kinase/response regulator